MSKTSAVDPQQALVFMMVTVSAADRDMTDQELRTIGEVIQYAPVFRDYEHGRLVRDAGACADILTEDEGLETILTLARNTLTPHLREAAYAFACDVAAADGMLSSEEIRLLEMIRHGLEIDRLVAAGIERGARARHATA